MIIKNANDAFNAVKDIIKRNDQEEVYAIYMDSHNKVLLIEFEALGDENSVVFPKKIICRNAIINLAMGVIIVHTHPSGDVRPSKADINETKELKEMLNVCNIQLLDHLIVSGDKERYYSFDEN